MSGIDDLSLSLEPLRSYDENFRPLYLLRCETNAGILLREYIACVVSDPPPARLYIAKLGPELEDGRVYRVEQTQTGIYIQAQLVAGWPSREDIRPQEGQR